MINYLRNKRKLLDLRNQLAKTYFHNKYNGMPNGVWAPMYHPVGILKFKK